MKHWRVLFFPFAFLYGLAVRLRHLLFDAGLLKSVSYPVPVIGIGNLSFGGTGKTPFVEFVVRKLMKQHRVAILSRGYGRKTSGFVLANPSSTFEDIGDEPLQYFHKFGKQITIAVDADRRHGIETLLQLPDVPEIIVLDDSFQHRYVKPGLSVLLTAYHKLYVDDHLLPVGTLRDVVSAASRADLVVVTKSHKVLSPLVRKGVEERLKLKPHQRLLFSHIEYGDWVPFPGVEPLKETRKKPGMIVVFSGIANPFPLEAYLRSRCRELLPLRFPDHHEYTEKDLLKIREAYEGGYAKRKFIVTTEKDAMRLINSPYFRSLEGLPLFYLPIRLKLSKEDRPLFDKILFDYVEKD